MYFTLLNINIDFSRMTKWIGTFIEGTITTLLLSLVTVIFGLLIAFLITSLRRSKFAPFSLVAKFYTLVVRGTPLLLQLYIWLYALPYIGFSLTDIPALGPVYGSREFLTAVLALSVNSGAYVAELLRGGLDAIDKGQTEAARSLGMSSFQTMRYVIVPQAFKVILPGLGNEFIQMIKESSIVSTVGIFDVMYAQTIVKSASYAVFEPLIIIAAIYLFLTSVLSFGLKLVERRLHVTHKSRKALQKL